MRLLGTYAIAIGLSAFLIFAVQPLMTKLMLPYLGGGAAVWNTAVMFFQGMLLLGYVYAHVGHHWLGARGQVWVHMLLVTLAVASLPLGLHATGVFTPQNAPISWSLVVLGASVGLPFFVLSANASLLQFWFAHSGHEMAENPYPLYAVSNAASLIALLSFPFVIEPFFGLQELQQYWSQSFVAFALLLVAVSLSVLWRMKQYPVARQEVAWSASWTQRIHWLGLAAIPSSLMLGITTYITTDLAAVPLFWVIPLALYLLSYVLAFAGLPWLYRLGQWLFMPLLLVNVLALLYFQSVNYVALVLQIISFFVIALVCHGRLAETSPKAEKLTEFYLWLAVGGFVGGVFNALLAPVLFNDVYEYLAMLWVACWLYPFYRDNRDYNFSNRDWLYGVCAGLALFAVAKAFPTITQPYQQTVNALFEAIRINPMFVCLAATLMFCMWKVRHSRPRSAAVLLIAILAMMYVKNDRPTLIKERNFFGVSKVHFDARQQSFSYLHGTTLHGQQSVIPEQRLLLTTYYPPVLEIKNSLQDNARKAPMAIAGLGVGTLACAADQGQQVDFFEINPHALQIARDKGVFTYLRDCPGKAQVIMGDARLEIEKRAENYYGLMVLDAYNSDSLPMHLLTQEATRIYMNKMTRNGVLAFHISNRHMDLAPIIGDIAESLGFTAYVKAFAPEGPGATSAQYVVVARNYDAVRALVQQHEGWKRVKPDNRRVWTDDFSNILQALNFFR